LFLAYRVNPLSENGKYDSQLKVTLSIINKEYYENKI